MKKTRKHHLAGYNFSLAGSSHLSRNKGCEDCSAIEKIHVNHDKTYLLMVSADGVGSCRYASVASNTVVSAATAYIRKQARRGVRPSVDVVQHAYQEAIFALWEKATTLGEPDLNDLGTTLDIAVLSENGRCYVGHNGDGGMLIIHSSGHVDTTGKMNTENGAVYTVDWETPSGQHAWAIHELSGVEGVIIATDGLYDYLTDYGRALDGSFFRKHSIFTTWKSKQQIRRQCTKLKRTLMGVPGEKRVTYDDITFVVGCRSSRIYHAAAEARLI